MSRPVVLAAVLVLTGSVVSAQPTTTDAAAGPGVAPGLGTSTLETSTDAVRLAVDVGAGATAAAPVRLDLTAVLRMTRGSRSVDGQNALTLWRGLSEAPKPRKGAIDWVGLFSEEFRLDGIMHMKRLTEPKTRREVAHSAYFGGYVQAVKGYLSTGWRWGDGDPFLTAYVMHPLMGSVYTEVFTNHDRRCKGVEYGARAYWGCIGRAALFGVVASTNWEWNPLLSESALGHVGKFHACANGRCSGDGGWTDFVATPLGGIGIRIAGDLARAKLWPLLDRHLSGNAVARILNVALKIATDPSRMVNAAANVDFRTVLSARPYTGRR